jgi:hypothetical protein
MSLVSTMVRVLCLAFAVTWAMPSARAAEETDARLAGLRVAMEQAESGLRALQVSRDALAARADTLAVEVAALKAAGERTALPGGRLDTLLKASQGIAETLSNLDRDVGVQTERLRASREARLAGLEAEMSAVRARLANGGSAEARREAFDRLKHLAQARDAVRTTVTPARGLGVRVALPAVDTEDSTPTELRELADEARDHAERVGRELDILGERLEALKARRRVLRGASEFARDESLFGEDERSRRTVRVAATSLSPADVRRATTGGGTTSSADGPRAPLASEGTRGGESNEDPVSGAAEPEAAPAPPAASGGDADFSDGAGAPAESDTDSDSVSGGGSVDDTPPSALPDLAVPVGAVEVSGGAADAVVFETAVEPGLLGGDPDALGPADLAEHIRRLERKRRALLEARRLLEARGATLEKGAER